MLQAYKQGDWIVHADYGLGEIKKVVEKEISGEPKRYYRVATANSVFWVPVDQMDDDLIRPVSSAAQIEKAITLFAKDAKEMSSSYKIRQKRIRDARNQNTPQAVVRLLRDLKAHWRKKRTPNIHERRVYQVLKRRLAREWALVTGNQAEKMESEIDYMLNPLLASTDRSGLDVPLEMPESRSKSSKHWLLWQRGQPQIGSH